MCYTLFVCDRAESLNYKLYIFGVLIGRPTDVLCESKGVVDNTRNFDSKLHQKLKSLILYVVQWSVVAETFQVSKIGTK